MMQKFKKRISFCGTQWLNVVVKSILIKYVLSFLLIYIGLGLLEPKGIMHNISSFIQNSVERWEKNEHKFHLVNWNIVRLPKRTRGLAIKDKIYEYSTRSKITLEVDYQVKGMVEAGISHQIFSQK